MNEHVKCTKNAVYRPEQLYKQMQSLYIHDGWRVKFLSAIYRVPIWTSFHVKETKL